MKKNFTQSFRHACLLYVMVLLGASLSSSAQVIGTFAGTGVPAFTADGVPANTSAVNTPYGVAVDRWGNAYIADYGNNRIRKVSATGTITTIAGTGAAGWSGDNGPATAAMINSPRGIAVDTSGNVFFSDYANGRIRRIDAVTGTITNFAGNGLIGFTGDGGLADTAQLNYAWGVAVDRAGNVYLADQFNCRIRMVNTAGIISTIAGTGFATYGGDSGPATAAKLQYPMGVAVDAAGNIFIADDGNARIRRIDGVTGIITTYAGINAAGYNGDGIPATTAKLRYPQGVAVDAAGDVYIADVNNNRIRKVTPDGIIHTLAGDGTAAYNGDGELATMAEINQATGVAVDSIGRVYIADNGNNRVRIIYSLIHAPYFIKGHHSHLTSCQTEILSIDSLLSIYDVDTGNTETWSVLSGAMHGTVNAAYTTTSTGATMLTTGLTYSPTLGFSGVDSFSVVVTDGTYADTTTVYVTIVGAPVVGAITGKDTLCLGMSATLSDTTSGGVWTSSNSRAAINGSGVVTMLAAGRDTITYTVTNMCATTAVTFAIANDTSSSCPSAVRTVASANAGKILVFPNPNQGIVTINLLSDLDEAVKFVVSDITGSRIREVNSTTNHPLDLALDVPPGIYFVSAFTVHGKTQEKITVLR